MISRDVFHPFQIALRGEPQKVVEDAAISAKGALLDVPGPQVIRKGGHSVTQSDGLHLLEGDAQKPSEYLLSSGVPVSRIQALFNALCADVPIDPNHACAIVCPGTELGQRAGS